MVFFPDFAFFSASDGPVGAVFEDPAADVIDSPEADGGGCGTVKVPTLNPNAAAGATAAAAGVVDTTESKMD